MITSTARLASILLCMIVVSSSTPSSHHGTLSSHQKYDNSAINLQAADQDKNEEIACISPDTNIYEIFHKAEKEARGIDIKCHFYLHNKEKSEYIGTLDINKALFDKLLGKYKHWLLTKLDTNNIGIKDEIDKVYNRLSDNAEAGDDKKNSHHTTHHHKPHHAKESHNIKETDDKRTKNKHYIELDPRYNETHRYFEVFLPKDKHKDDPRTIYINVDEENKEFSLFDNEKHREMNYKPIKIGLRELSAIADVIFSKAEAGNNVFTVNDENSEDSEKYEIKNVDYETVDKKEDENSFDLDSNTVLANDSDVSSNENDTIEHGYTELNETDVKNHNDVVNDTTTNYLDLNNTETNAIDDSIHLENQNNNIIDFNETDKANNDTEPYTDDNIVENNESEPYSNYDQLGTDNNENFDNDTFTKVEVDKNTDKTTITDDKKDTSNKEIHELPSGDTENQENVVQEDLTRSQPEKTGLRTPFNYAPVPEFTPRFENICNNQLVLLNPTKMSNTQPCLETSHPLSNALDNSNKIPSNFNFDSCMKPNVLSPNCNACNSVTIPYDSTLNELISPNDCSKNIASEILPKQNLFSLPNEPCLIPPCNTMNVPIQNDRNFQIVPSNVLNNAPKIPPAILNQQNLTPPKTNANYLDTPATAPIQNGVLNSIPNFNKYKNYNPLAQNPFPQPSPCIAPKELSTFNKNIISNSFSNPFATKPISPLNYPYIKPNFPSYPQIPNQNRPCLPFNNKGQNPIKSQSNIGLNLPLNNLCIPNQGTESTKKYSPFNIHLTPNEDLTIDPTKYGYITAMPFTKFPTTSTKPLVSSFKMSANNNQIMDSSEHSLLDSALTGLNLPFKSSFEDKNRNFVGKSTISNSNLDSFVVGPHLNSNNSPYLSNANNFHNVNVLSNKNLDYSLTSPKLNINTSPFLSNSNNFQNVNVMPSETLDSSLANSQLNFNNSPLLSNANNFNNVNVIPDKNLVPSLIGPQLNLNSLPFPLNANNFNNANVLPNKNLDSTLTGPNMNYNSPLLSNTNNLNNAYVLPDKIISPQMNLNTSPFSFNSNKFNNVNVMPDKNSDTSFLGPQLDLNTSPISTNANNLSNANVLSDKDLESLIQILSQAGYVIGQKKLATPEAIDLVEDKLIPQATLDSTLIGSGLDLNAAPNDLMSGPLTSNVLSLSPLDSGLIGSGLANVIRPLDSTSLGSNLNLNKSPSNFISDTVTSNVSPTTLNEVNAVSNLDLHGINPLDSSLVGSGLTLDKNGKLMPLNSSPIDANVGLNVFSSSFASSNVLPTDFNKGNTESIASKPLDSTLIGPKLDLASLALDRSLIGPSLKTLFSQPTLENRAPVNIIVHNDTVKVNVPKLLEDTLQSKVGRDEVEQLPQGGDASTKIHVELPKSFDTNETTNATDTDNVYNSNIKETELPGKLNGDLEDELPLGGNEPNTINVDLTKNTETQIQNPNNTINTDEGKLINNLKDTVITPDISQTKLDINSTTKGLESYGNIDIVEPSKEISHLGETVIDSDINKSSNVEEFSRTSNIQVNIDKPELNANGLEDNTELEQNEHIKLIDVTNTINNEAKLEDNPNDTVVLYTTKIKDGDLHTQTDENNYLKGPVKEINVTDKLKATNAPNEVIDTNTEATNPTINLANDSEVTVNGPDDIKKVTTQESRITIPNDEIMALDSSLLGPNLALSKETPLNLIGGKVDNSFKGPGLFPKSIGIQNTPDISVDNISHTSLTSESLLQDNTIEINSRVKSDAILDSSLVGPGLNLDANINLANDKERDKLNLATDANIANNLIEDRFLADSLVSPTLTVDEYMPSIADNPLQNMNDANKLQHALLSILNSGKTIDSSLSEPDLLTLSKNAEDSLDIKESPEFVTSRFTPVDSFVNNNDYNFNTAPMVFAPSTAGTGSLFVCTVPSVKSIVPSPPMLPSVSSQSLPYSNVLSSSYPPFSYLNLSPYTINEYPPLFLPPLNPYKSSILPNQNFLNTILPKSLPSICSYPIIADNSLPSASESRSLSIMPSSQPTSMLNSFSSNLPSSLSLAKPYQTFALPSQSVIKDNSFTVSQPSVTPKLPEDTINPFSTQSSPAYTTKPCITNSNALSSVPIFSNSMPLLVPSPTTISSKPSSDINTLSNSPSLPVNKPLYYPPLSLSFSDQVHPSIQFIKLPYLPDQASNTQFVSSSDFQNPQYNYLSADNIKLPKELQYPTALSTRPISFYTQMDSPINKWAIPSSLTPVQNVANPFSSIPTSLTPGFPKISTHIPENRPLFQIPSTIPINIPLSKWKPSLSMSSLIPESQIIDSEKETLLFNEIMSLLEQPNFELPRDAHTTGTLPPNIATASILNSIPMTTEFNLQSASPLSPSSFSMNPVTPPLSSNLINYNLNLNMPSHFEAQPKEIIDMQNIIPNVEMKEPHNNFIVGKETINEIECLLEREKQSHFDANVMSELKEPMYSVTQGNFEPCAMNDRTPISMPFAKPILGTNNVNLPNAMYNLAPIDFNPYTADDKAPILMSSSVPYTGTSLINNLNAPNTMYSLTPSKYEPYTINDKTPICITNPVSFTATSPCINSFMAPHFLPKSSAPNSNQYSPYTPVIENKLASLPPSSIESSSLPSSDTISVTNEENLRTDSLILPNNKLTPLSLAKSKTEPLNEIKDTLPKTDSFKLSDIDLKGFEPYVEDTETNVAKPEDNAIEDERLVYSNDLFDKNHEEPIISETEELNYVEEEKDLLPYASLNRDAFGQAKTPSLRGNVPQNTFNNLPIETIVPLTKYATPISTLSVPLLTPISLAPIPTYKNVNSFKTLPVCQSLVSPSISSIPSSINYPSCILPNSIKPLRYSPIPTFSTSPTSSVSSPNTVSLSTTFNSYLPKPSSQLPPSSKLFLNSPMSLINSLPNNLQYLAPTNPSLPISINPTSSSAPNILDTVPFISSPQIKEQPCPPFEFKPCVPGSKVSHPLPCTTLCTVLNSTPYVPVNKVSYPVPGVSPCSVFSLPCDNTVSSSPTVYKSPKLTSLPSIIPVATVPTLPASKPTLLPISGSFPVPNINYSAYTPNYASKTLPIPPFTLNVTPLDKKPSLPPFISPYISQIPLNSVYRPSALSSSIELPYTLPTSSNSLYSPSVSTLSSPVIQTLDLPSNPYLPFSKMPSITKPICQNVSSPPPSTSLTPYFIKPAITNYVTKPCKISTDLNKNLEISSPRKYLPSDTAYSTKNTVTGIKNPFTTSFVSPKQMSPSLQVSNVLNPFINSVKPNPNLFTSTAQTPPLISSHLSLSTPKLPLTTEKPISITTKNYPPQNLPFLSNNPLLPKTESLNYPPCIITTMPSKPLTSGSLGNIQSIEVPSLPLTPSPLWSYNLIKSPSIKPCQPPCIPFHIPAILPTNSLPNAPIESPIPLPTSTTFPKPFSPILRPTIIPYQYYLPCDSINIPEYSPLANGPINSPKLLPNIIDTTVPKPYSPTFGPTIPTNQYNPPCVPFTDTPLNSLPVSLKPNPIVTTAPKTYKPNILTNIFYPPCQPFNIPANPLTDSPINSPILLPSSPVVPNPYTPIFRPTVTPNQDYTPYVPFNIPTNTLANTPMSSPTPLPTNTALPKFQTPTSVPTMASNQYNQPSTLINVPESLSARPLASTPTNISPTSYSVPIATIASKNYSPTIAPIIQTFSPTQTLVSTNPQSNIMPLYLTPKYLESPIVSSIPNICSDSVKPPTVSLTQSPSLSRPLYSRLLSLLAYNPLISPSKQLPVTNPPCSTIAPSSFLIPSLKSPYLQETVTPSSTVFQPLSPVSSGAKSPIISPSTYQPLSPILSSFKSPVTSINLPQSQSYTTPSDFPIKTPKSVQKPPFFLTPQNYRDLTQIPTPSITSHSQPCPPPNKVINPISPPQDYKDPIQIPSPSITSHSQPCTPRNKIINPLTPIEFLMPESRLQENDDFVTLGDLNNLPNSLDGYKPYDVEEEITKKDGKLEEKEFDNKDLYTEESLYDTTTEPFEYNTNKEHLEDTIHYTDNTRSYDTNKPTEFNNPILESSPNNKQENRTDISEEPQFDINVLSPEISNKNPVIDSKNAYNRPITMNLKPNPQNNVDNLDFKPRNTVDFNEMPNMDNIKYSGYKSYQMPLANLKNLPPFICNTYPPIDSNSGLKNNYNPTNMYAPVTRTLAQPENDFNNFNLSPKSLDLRQDSSNQPEINLNYADQSPKSYDLTPDTKEIKDSLIKYINKNDIAKENGEITVPIGNIVIVDNTPIVNNIEDLKHTGLDLKMWKSNLKIVNAEVKLKCKEISFNNFMPIAMKDSTVDYGDVIKRYIEDKYGKCIVMNEPYSQENRHSVLNHFEPHTVRNQFNLLWPSHRW